MRPFCVGVLKDRHHSMTSRCSQNESGAAWTIGRLLDWTRDHFQARHVDGPRLSAELLLANVLGCRRIDLYARYTDEPTPDQRASFREMVQAAAEHKPIAYLIGVKEFYSLNFRVTSDVLIPRPETELLVERALAWCEERLRIADCGLRIDTRVSASPIPNPQSAILNRIELLDIGTGSGCIAVTLAKRQPAVHAVATDVSESALTVARENAGRHGVADRVRCVQADMLDLPSEVVPDGGFDIIVSNPPYVAENEYDSLPKNVRDYEPAAAILSGGDGLEAIRRIAEGIRRMMRPGGTLIIEVGHTQADAVEDIFTKTAQMKLHGRYKDLNGIDRAIQFTLPA